jgi:hypothetical protein
MALSIRNEQKQKARMRGLFGKTVQQVETSLGGQVQAAPCTFALLELGFFIRNVLAYNRIVLDEFKLFRGGTLVLVGGIEVAGTRRGFQFDLFATAFSHF